MNDIRLFSYKMTDDTGFAPNPFHGLCTLATCKADIRLKKRKGDWIAGFTSGDLNGDPVGEERLVYLMHVSNKIGLDAYYRDPAYAAKIPADRRSNGFIDLAGDNIYFLEGGRMKQVKNVHHGEGNLDDDTSGEFVLIAEDFCYFGSKPLVIDRSLRPTVPLGQAGNGWRTHDGARAKAFIDHVKTYGRGVHAAPHGWPMGDESWNERALPSRPVGSGRGQRRAPSRPVVSPPASGCTHPPPGCKR